MATSSGLFIKNRAKPSDAIQLLLVNSTVLGCLHLLLLDPMHKFTRCSDKWFGKFCAASRCQ